VEEAREAIERWEEDVEMVGHQTAPKTANALQVLLSGHDSISEMIRKVRDGAIEHDHDTWRVLDDEDID
jgi:hypothetical protein